METIDTTNVKLFPKGFDYFLQEHLPDYHGNQMVDDLFRIESFLECGKFADEFKGMDDHALREKVQELQFELYEEAKQYV
jgi:hypothetical protein